MRAKSPERTAEIYSEKISESVKPNETNELYEFGQYRLDAKKRRLWRNGEIVSLTPKEFDILFALVRQAGVVVEKDDLLDAVWKDVYVDEATLTRNISFLRKKLGGEKFIETLPKRGYRFLSAVRRVENQPALIVEEQTLTKITVEETFSITGPPASADPPLRPNAAVAQLPPYADGKRRRVVWLAAVGLLLATAVGFIVYQNFIKKPPLEVINVASVVPFSGVTGRENMPAFSPDGKQIAFVWNGGNEVNNFDIYLKLVGPGEPVRLTKNESDDLFPAFAPDGKSIAFVRSYPTRSEVFMIPALGGAERKIADLGSIRSSISFSPDGNTLAVADTGQNSTATAIYLLDIESGRKTALTAPTETASDDSPVFTSDGKTVSFLRAFGAVWQEILTVDAAGGPITQLTSDKTRIRGLAAAPDGKIVFASQRVNNQWNLWQLSSTGGEPQMIVTGGKNLANPAVSADGGLIAFAEESTDTNIWRFELHKEGTSEEMRTAQVKNPTTAVQPSSLPPQPLVASSRADHSPYFSSDGKRILFVSDRSGIFQIWSADADGANQMQLTNVERSAGTPRFSPDGNWVAFDTQADGNSDVFIMNPNGGELRNLTASPSQDSLPSWSVDGQTVYFASNRGGDYQLWKIPATGGKATRLTKSGAFESFASPDGNEIYYTKERGVTGIWRISVNGENESPVPELADAGYWRYWTVTSRGIFYVARSSNAPYTIRFYDFLTKSVNNVTATDKAPIWIFGGFAASPDGGSVLYAHSDQNASSIMLAATEK